VLLTGTRSVPTLAVGATHTDTVTVTIPAATPLSVYYLPACAASGNGVVEMDEGNNCIATTTAAVKVARPDLAVTTATTNPPNPAVAPGATFKATDTVKNLGLIASGSSTTRYYLSLDTMKSANDILLTGTRRAGARGRRHEHANGYRHGSREHAARDVLRARLRGPGERGRRDGRGEQLPRGGERDRHGDEIRPGRDGGVVTAGDEGARHHLRRDGHRGEHRRGRRKISTTRYWLSLDPVNSAGDTLLTGSRPVPALDPGETNAKTITVTIPAATPLNTCYLIACADHTGAVSETDEANNCEGPGDDDHDHAVASCPGPFRALRAEGGRSFVRRLVVHCA
jgi:hypothetical protein